tara:strand:- start:320 stop:523 length:204 start_codon:yes stop_codon:yes gene_type:complete
LFLRLIKYGNIKRHRAVSLSMYLVMIIGVFLWGIYGFMIESLPVIISNSITFIIQITIIYFRLKHGK